MLSLGPATFEQIKPYFEKKSNQMPPAEAEIIGIYDNQALIGYFITLAHVGEKFVLIHQFYLEPSRYRKLSQSVIKLLEDKVKPLGYTKVLWPTTKVVNNYFRFMSRMNYRITQALFVKDLI